MRTRLLSIADRLESVSRGCGVACAWLAVAMVLVMSAVVVQRYVFDTGSIKLQESITFMHAALFLLTAGYTLACNDHVRVDIFYSRLDARGQALVDLLGTLFLLLPFCVFLLWTSWDFVAVSWSVREASPESGGLPFPFPPLMKGFIPVAAVLLLMQGAALALRAAVTLTQPAGAR